MCEPPDDVVTRISLPEKAPLRPAAGRLSVGCPRGAQTLGPTVAAGSRCDSRPPGDGRQEGVPIPTAHSAARLPPPLAGCARAVSDLLSRGSPRRRQLG